MTDRGSDNRDKCHQFLLVDIKRHGPARHGRSPAPLANILEKLIFPHHANGVGGNKENEKEKIMKDTNL